MACSCKSSANNVTTVKQVVKKTKVGKSSSTEKRIVPQRTVARRISYRRPI